MDEASLNLTHYRCVGRTGKHFEMCDREENLRRVNLSMRNVGFLKMYWRNRKQLVFQYSSTILIALRTNVMFLGLDNYVGQVIYPVCVYTWLKCKAPSMPQNISVTYSKKTERLYGYCLLF